MNLFLNPSNELRSGFRAAAFYLFSVVVLVAAQTVVKLCGLSETRVYEAVVYTIEAAAIFGVTALLFRWIDHSDAAPLGLGKRNGGFFFAGSFMGGVAGIGVVFVAVWLRLPTKSMPSVHPSVLVSRAFLLGLVIFLFAASVEEMLFRGYPFLVLHRSLGRWGASICLSVLFVGVHPNLFHSAAAVISIFLGGIFLTQLFVLAKSLWLPIGFHFGWNLAQDVIFPLPGHGATVIAVPNFDPATVGLTIGAEQSWWAVAVLILLVIGSEIALHRESR